MEQVEGGTWTCWCLSEGLSIELGAEGPICRDGTRLVEEPEEDERVMEDGRVMEEGGQVMEGRVCGRVEGRTGESGGSVLHADVTCRIHKTRMNIASLL